MSSMRFTVVQDEGGISFVGDEYWLPALVAACSTDPNDVDQFLVAAHEYDRRPRQQVRNELAVFDEHNIPGEYDEVHLALDRQAGDYGWAFRIVDERTRQASLQPVKAGLIIFNLAGHRIVQVQNSVRIERQGEARHHNGRQWTRRVHPYTLPDSWSVVP